MNRAPDFVQPLLGYRAWYVSKSGRLEPLTGGRSWDPGPNEAECYGMWTGPNPHAAPGADCRCGFNAFLSPDAGDISQRRDWVIGAIAAWGEIEVYRSGFRSQFACVVALASSDSDSLPRLERLTLAARTYGVRLVPRSLLAAEASAFGASLPESALPSLPKAPRRASRRRRPTPRRSTAPARLVVGPTAQPPLVPERGSPWSAGETGYWLRAHLAARMSASRLELFPTAGFLAAVGPPHTVRFRAAGGGIQTGEVVAVVDTARGRFAVPCPVRAGLLATNAGLGARGGGSPLTKDSWIARLDVSDIEIAASPLVWGIEGWGSYRAYVHRRDDRQIRRELALGPPPPEPAAETVIGREGGLRWLALLLDRRLAGDQPLQEELRRRRLQVAFHVPGLGNLEVRPAGDRHHVIAEDGSDGDCLTLRMSEQALHEYWSGELDLAAAIGFSVRVRGSRAEALRATALLRRLCPAYASAARGAAERGRTAQRALAVRPPPDGAQMKPGSERSRSMP